MVLKGVDLGEGFIYFCLKRGLERGMVSHDGGLSSGVQLYPNQINNYAHRWTDVNTCRALFLKSGFKEV